MCCYADVLPVEVMLAIFKLYFFLATQIAQVAQPWYLNGPGNLGSLDSKTEIQRKIYLGCVMHYLLNEANLFSVEVTFISLNLPVILARQTFMCCLLVGNTKGVQLGFNSIL